MKIDSINPYVSKSSIFNCILVENRKHGNQNNQNNQNSQSKHQQKKGHEQNGNLSRKQTLEDIEKDSK